jgi:hypothetical protein
VSHRAVVVAGAEADAVVEVIEVHRVVVVVDPDR